MSTLIMQCINIANISTDQKMTMFRLMDTHYANVDAGTFLKDLAQKQWALMLRTENGQLVGFSTQRILDFSFEGNNISVVFSGDTVIDQAHRGSQALAWGFGRFMLEIQQQRPACPLYWLLTSKGIRTYRYLPLYFNEFSPRFDKPTPLFHVRLIDNLCAYLFPSRYDRTRGILLASEDAQRQREFDIPDRDSINGHCHYFSKRNPGFRSGEELVCLAEFSRSNVNDRVWRAIDRHPPLIPETFSNSDQNNILPITLRGLA